MNKQELQVERYEKRHAMDYYDIRRNKRMVKSDLAD